MPETDPHWYKDAIVYQLHVKGFFDSNGDGIGDFQGLTRKLDYLSDLGVNTLWLLPFYPSPLRDDGYDIADYRSINPSYGSMRDFKQFVREAHRRNLRVITELVINHTSDQHPWFQRARHAPPSSAARKFYVWSDDDHRYAGTRIIFCDTEPSNWSWDPIAKAYYWHRFFNHQPDLNFDNPRVFDEVTRVMKYWLNCGVDGLRLDAIPYLCEREGTNNENLPETHAVLKKLRGWLDAHFNDRMFLGEANQWPEDVRPYFGDGDECHMAFHFPLMPRMYMALAQEDRHPITDIMRQTPDIPDSCQWAVFLRNHDELTLEMVSDRERDYLWQYYAADKRARINLGIRRRLAPLLDNDRRKIELLNSLLMSMPGTPIIYYGDEIGMGDNIFLGDRNGVRTPMQWSPDRNAGFSKADPQSLFLPPIMDPVYGFEAVNVEAQSRAPSSLLNWMRRLIAARKAHQVFGRGKLTFLYPGNRKIFAYLREDRDGDEVILCVANLSPAPQAAELDLSRFNGRVPIELLGRSTFPPVGDLPYFVTLPAYGFYWFLLAAEAEPPTWHEPYVTPMPDLETLVLSHGWQGLRNERVSDTLHSRILPEFLPKQRWFAAKDRTIRSAYVSDHAELSDDGDVGFLITVTQVTTDDGLVQGYMLPLGILWEGRADEAYPPNLQPHALGRARRFNRIGLLHDAMAGDRFTARAIRAIRAGEEIGTAAGGKVMFWKTPELDTIDPAADFNIQKLGREQSNTSMLVGDQMIFKAFRRLDSGIHPEIEMGRFLSRVAEFDRVPHLLGAIEMISPDGSPTALGVLQRLVPNMGDCWTFTLSYVKRYLEGRSFVDEEANPELDVFDQIEGQRMYLDMTRTLGRRIGELHCALCTETDDPAFTVESVTPDDVAAWKTAVHEQANAARAALLGLRTTLSEEVGRLVDSLLANWVQVESMIFSTTLKDTKIKKSRCHGDLHLGQVVVMQDDFYILDFEGEPVRSLAERRAKGSPLRDVAGMIRSFNYAAWASLYDRAVLNPDAMQAERAWAAEWERRNVDSFLEGYRETASSCASVPGNRRSLKRLLNLFILEKALYEICYEAANRPDWVRIPVQGVSALLSGRGGE